jgi:hypothetical protein
MGYAGCDNNKADYFGRFDKSWHNYGLNSILNPNGTSSGSHILSMQGDDPCVPAYYFENTNDLHTSTNVNGMYPYSEPVPGTRTYNGVYTASNVIGTGQNVVIQSGTSVEFYAETIVLRPGFKAEAGSRFIASSKPCIRGCNTTYSATLHMSDSSYNKDTPILSTDKNRKSNTSHRVEDEETNIVYNDIRIFPNPNNGSFTIGSNEAIQQIEVYNLLGQVVYKADNPDDKTIQLPADTKGVFFVRITTQTECVTKKILVQ